MTQLLDRILEPQGLSLALQPIFEISPEGRRLHSMECLTRGPEGTNAESSDILFTYLRLKQQEVPLDHRCVAHALEVIAGMPGRVPFSINVHTATLCSDRDFVEFLSETTAETGMDPTRLILEIIEHQPVWETRRLVDTLSGLRSLGVRIALDDIGSGHSTFKRLLDCQPDLFKIDRSVIHDCHRDARRLAVVRAILLMARSFQAEVVAEGVEEEGDLRAILEAGVSLVQGFALARPFSIEDTIQFLNNEASCDFAGSEVSGASAELPREAMTDESSPR